ncbi:MAG: nitrate respiration regulation response regulator NreC [Candidatus Promineifilaceae bacterium]
MSIKIIVADNHVILREGISLLLNNKPEMEVIAQVASGLDAVQQAVALNPDIVLLDFNLPEINGLDTARQIMQASPQTKTLILTQTDDDSLFFKTIQMGASGYLLKNARPSELYEAITAVYEGNLYISPPMQKKLVSRLLNNQPPTNTSSINTLTKREKEVMALLTKGLKNREIAEQLNISISTAQTHRTNIMKKLNLANRSELIHFAIRHNLLAPSGTFQ